MLKYIFYLFHLLFIFISFFFCFFYWQVLILHFLTILSWYINNNECIITRLEDRLFNETVIDIYNKCRNNYKKNNRRFIVPYYQRYPLYLLFTLNLLYLFYKY